MSNSRKQGVKVGSQPEMMPLFSLRHGWPAIRHEIVQLFLRLLRFDQILNFQHFAFIFYHLIDSDRVVFAVVGAVVIDIAAILILIWQLPQPRTPFQLFASVRGYPNIPATDITIDSWPKNLPIFYFACRCR